MSFKFYECFFFSRLSLQHFSVMCVKMRIIIIIINLPTLLYNNEFKGAFKAVEIESSTFSHGTISTKKINNFDTSEIVYKNFEII